MRYSRTTDPASNYNRAITLYTLEVYNEDNKLVGQGYVMKDFMQTSTPVLSDMEGKQLPEKWYDLRVIDSYACVINSMIH